MMPFVSVSLNKVPGASACSCSYQSTLATANQGASANSGKTADKSSLSPAMMMPSVMMIGAENSGWRQH